MKKIIKNAILTTVAIATFAINSAQAKTEGAYIGANISRNEAKFNGKEDNYGGYGASFKYAFNSHNAFIAPGVFADKLQNKVTQGGNQLRAEYRYGAKLDIGYDITRDLSAYVTGGVARVRYKTTNAVNGRDTDDKYAAIYGIGAKYALTNNLAFTFEYNRQSRGKFKDSAGLKTPSEINAMQFGLALNF